jgi:hypothetical protein
VGVDETRHDGRARDVDDGRSGRDRPIAARPDRDDPAGGPMARTAFSIGPAPVPSIRVPLMSASLAPGGTSTSIGPAAQETSP